MRKKTHLKTTAIIVAAGNSTRMTNQNKIFAELCGKPVLAHTLQAFELAEAIDEIVIVTREESILLVSDIVKAFGITKASDILRGGDTRRQSVKNGIDNAEADIIAVHDGARPCVLPEHIDSAVQKAIDCGAAALGTPVVDTLKLADESLIIKDTVNRENLWHIQTPQVFRYDIIKNAHDTAERDGIEATDDCALVEAAGDAVCIVRGAANNIKITTQEDIFTAERILEAMEL